MKLLAPPTNVSVGASTIAGYSVTAAGFAAAIIAYATGARDAQTLGVLTAAAVATVAFLVTQVGRYAQAHTLAKGVAEKVADTSVKLDGREVASAANMYSSIASVASDVPPGHTTYPEVESQYADDIEEGGDHDAIPHVPTAAPDVVGEDLGDPGSLEPLPEDPPSVPAGVEGAS